MHDRKKGCKYLLYTLYRSNCKLEKLKLKEEKTRSIVYTIYRVCTHIHPYIRR